MQDWLENWFEEWIPILRRSPRAILAILLAIVLPAGVLLLGWMATSSHSVQGPLAPVVDAIQQVFGGRIKTRALFVFVLCIVGAVYQLRQTRKRLLDMS